ncbi:hypothetical protein G0Q06_00750 [Puniceicoccales bacterium CK1056]|uniref:Uncharacterized protein n=1 Tax=Oceanipulchritudo coccoides TaxID=2706888 RepID=A0A6B2LXY1_9BACT|nr:hypothetical protein [Oceanipulchritudo coccoides]NDV60972.1 hypothetical protein [Oceanipulchritudo coccoides]
MSRQKKSRKRLSKKRVLEAIEDSHGVVYDAARRLGCARSSLHRFIAKNGLTAHVDSARAELLDIAEHHLAKAVKIGCPWAVRYVLGTLGKERFGSEAAQVAVTFEALPRIQVVEFNPKTGAPVKPIKKGHKQLWLPSVEQRPQ